MNHTSRWIALSLIAAAALSFFPLQPARADGEKDKELEDAVKVINDNATSSFDQHERRKAMERLVNIATPEAATVLCELLGDPFPHIQEFAEILLGGMGGEGINQAIAQAGIHEEGLSKNAKPHVNRRAAAARVLGRRFATDQIEALIEALEDREMEVSAAGAWALGEVGGKEAIETLQKKGLRKKGAALGASLRALGRLGIREEAADKVEKAIKDRDWQAAVGAADYCAEMGADEFLPILLEGLDKAKDHQIKIAIAQALAELSDAENINKSKPAWEILLDQEEQDWRVRRRTVEALVELWQPLSIELLTKHFPEGNTDTMLFDFVHALEDLSGAKQPYRADAWRLWWQQELAKGTYKMRDKPKRPEHGWLRAPKDEARVKADGDEGGKTKGTSAFFEIPVLKEDAYFVFDFSGSMRDNLPGSSGPCKADLARQELFGVLESYMEEEDEDKRPKFNVLLYRFPSAWPFRSPDPAPGAERLFGTEMKETDEKTIRQAKDWIGEGEDKVHGRGAFYEAFVAAMEDPGCQVIYFLSDGAPSAGKAARWDHLPVALKEATRFHPVRINTVLIGPASSFGHKKLMETIASGHCGEATNPHGKK